jgi:hypothetical protein
MPVAVVVARYERLFAVVQMPFNSPSAASFNAAFTSSTVTSFSSSATKSTTETFGVGTRIAIPFSFPFNSGKTSATAFAAPVVVGMMILQLHVHDEVFMRQVQNLLVVRVRVNGRHHTAFMPNFSCSTLANGAKQFVVHEAFEMT